MLKSIRNVQTAAELCGKSAITALKITAFTSPEILQQLNEIIDKQDLLHSKQSIFEIVSKTSLVKQRNKIEDLVRRVDTIIQVKSIEFEIKFYREYFRK